MGFNQADERQEFIIDNPGKADWAIREVKNERIRRDLFIQAAYGNIEQLREQIKDATVKCDNETSFLLSKLNEYIGTVPAKKTKTQMTFILPSGKLIKKLPKIEYRRDDEKLLKYLKDSDPSLIKIKEDINWAELKKDLNVQDGIVIRNSTGEIIESITAAETPETFDVE